MLVHALQSCQRVGYTVDDLFEFACGQVLESNPQGCDLSADCGLHEDSAPYA